jgi:hypothetical protein
MFLGLLPFKQDRCYVIYSVQIQRKAVLRLLYISLSSNCQPRILNRTRPASRRIVPQVPHFCLPFGTRHAVCRSRHRKALKDPNCTWRRGGGSVFTTRAVSDDCDYVVHRRHCSRIHTALEITEVRLRTVGC